MQKQKKQNCSDYVVAFIVVGCSLVLLGALTMALTGFNFNAFGRTLRIDFESVAGIRVNSEVRYAGKRIGVVKTIEFIPMKERLQKPDHIIRVSAQLQSDAPVLYQGATAAIISDTVLAEKFVDITPVQIEPGAELPPKLSKDDIIQGKKVVGFDDLTRSGYEVVDNVNHLLSELKTKHPELPSKIGSLIIHSESLMAHADEFISRGIEMLKKNDPNLEKTLSELRIIAQNLKVTTTYAKALTAVLAEKPWRLVWGGDTYPLPSEQEILDSTEPLPIPRQSGEEEEEKEDGQVSCPTVPANAYSARPSIKR